MSAVLDVVVPRRRAASADARFAADVLAGLARPQKAVPSTWLYDRRGSALFELITELPEYYPARIETSILQQCAGAIAEAAGPGAALVELGSGSSRKTPIVLGALQRPAVYVPVDISAEFVAESVHALLERFPALQVAPLFEDFTRLAALPERARDAPRRVVFFPGTTIGNLTPPDARLFLERIGRAAGPETLLVVGVDTTRDPALLIPAYDDPGGVTAAFNKNLLARMNRELDADFAFSAFRHEARWNGAEKRVEMHLVSEYTQQVRVLGRRFRFERGESIHTENSYKHSLLGFRLLAQRAGWRHLQLWTDSQAHFAVHVLAWSPSLS
jgi:L-histidine Nalpha-methyltransferase